MKRTGCILMTLILLLCAVAVALPAPALAEGTTVTLGAGPLTEASTENKVYVYFGNQILWRVLQSGDGKALLISNDTLASIQFNQSTSDGNAWSGSKAQTWCSDYYTNWPAGIEKNAILATTIVETGNYTYSSHIGESVYGPASLNDEYFFFLSVKEAVDLFADENDRKASGASSMWWLRSPLATSTEGAGYVLDNGWVIPYYVDCEDGARPAFNLNLGSVLYTAAVSGETNTWKLTLYDSNMTVTEGSGGVTRSGSTVTVPYSITGSDAGNANKVALLITGKNDTWTAANGWSSGAAKLYYETKEVTSTSGSVSFTLPDSLKDKTCGTDYKAWLLAVDEAEGVNKAHQSDYASAPVEITIPAPPRAEISLDAGVMAEKHTVWFASYDDDDYPSGPVQWRVLSGSEDADPSETLTINGTQTTLPVSKTGEVLLISSKILDDDCYFMQGGSSNAWAGSDAQAWCSAFYNALPETEKGAVNATTLNETDYQSEGSYQFFYKGGHGGNRYYSAAPLNGERDHFFFLSAREADKLFDNDDDRVAYKANGNSWYWWLRSPYAYSSGYAGIVDTDGWVRTYVDNYYGARPAFNLNLSSVLFVSAAVGGKSIAVEDGTSSGAEGAGVYKIPSGSKTDWKLTLKDDSRTGFASSATSLTGAPGGKISIPFSGAKTGENEYVSILICDSTGAAQFYGSCKISAASGTANFVLPSATDLPTGNYTVKVFNEQKNGQHESDYASDFVSIPLTVKNAISYKVTFKVANGYWNSGSNDNADKTVTLSGFEGDTLKLASDDIPAVGGKPIDNTYKAGGWDTTPSTETAITQDTTYTYTYAKKGSISATVTFKVVNGSWNDETLAAEHSVTLEGYEGDTLKLTAAQIPAVGNKPDDTYKAGSWDTTPSTETAFANGSTTTYTYTYAKKDSISATVIFKVVNGGWNDETLAAEHSVTLAGYEGDTLKLTDAQIPTAGNKPNDTYKAGNWDTIPTTETTFANGSTTTYTYTYAAKDAISQTVTFKVVNGSWDDGNAADITVTLTGLEGDTLKLAAGQIPAVGNKPADTYKAGAWDVTPSTETAITAPTTYTYTYAAKDAISQTVTFKVVNGAWDDGNSADITVTLTGHEGDTLRLAADQIPAVGKKPADTYKAGAWDVMPSTETAITAPTTYTYTYAPKDGISQTVTFKVVNGAWDDGTVDDKTITLTGHEGDTLKLAANQIPAVGNKPAENYQAGSWDVTPNTETAITADTTFTYTYVVIPNVETKTETSDLNTVPAALANKYPTLEALKQDLLLKLVVEGEPARMENTVFYDVELMLSLDGGKTWIPATEENFPVGGLPVTLPYPEGTDADNFNFAVAHMFTITSARLGTVAGEIEYPAVTATDDGLLVTLHGLSPVAIAYEPIEPEPPKDPTKFEDVAVPSDTFTFKKVWEGGYENSIDFTLYKLGDTVYHHGFDKKIMSKAEWKYNAWFSEAVACYVIEKPVPGYKTVYENVGVYAEITDRCCDGGTIINYRIPKTGDDANLILWIGCALAGLVIISIAVYTGKKRKKRRK